MTSISILRKVVSDGKEIIYHLEQKPVKNLNLRIRKDGSVYVSANDDVPVGKVDEFVVSKGSLYSIGFTTISGIVSISSTAKTIHQRRDILYFRSRAAAEGF